MNTLNSNLCGTTSETSEKQSTTVAALLEVAFKCIENGEWNDADANFERVLEQEPENAEAYLGKAMAEIHCARKNALKGYAETLDNNDNYNKAIQFAAPEFKAELEGYLKDGIYDDALKMMQSARAEAVCRVAAEIFESISGWKDADARREEALEKAESIRKDLVYAAAEFKAQMNFIFSVEEAIEKYESIPGWRDSDERLANCKAKLEVLKAAEEQKKQEAAQRAADTRSLIAAKVKKFALPVVIGIVLVCAIIIGVCALKNTVIPNNKYNKAIALLENEQYEEARAIFVELGDYKDTREQIRKIQWNEAQVGDTLVFGNYGGEEVEWLVLDKEDERILAISKYILDCRAFNTEFEFIDWESSSLRAWLNSTFIENAFSAEEQTMIVETLLSNPDNSTYGTAGCDDTLDKVFLLSVDEAEMYFPSNKAREATGTAYARKQTLYIAADGNAWWWLRSPGSSNRMIADVTRDGEVDDYGFVVTGSIWYGVRPALWLSIG